MRVAHPCAERIAHRCGIGASRSGRALRWGAVLTTLIALGCSPTDSATFSATFSATLVTEEILEAGGRLEHDRSENLVGVSFRGVKDNPDRLAARLAALPQLRRADFTECPLTDQGLAAMAPLPLESLNLQGTAVTDAGLKTLEGHKTLKSLILAETELTVEGWKIVASMPQLEELALPPSAGDDDLKSLATLASLRILYAGKTGIRGSGLAWLASIPLKTLYLDETPIDDDGLSSLPKLRHLERLGLSRTSVSDSGLEHLRLLRNLDYLSLGETEITDQGIFKLGDLSKLYVLDIPDTNVSDAAVEVLKERIPSILIAR